MAIVAIDTGRWPPLPGEPEYTGTAIWPVADTAG